MAGSVIQKLFDHIQLDGNWKSCSSIEDSDYVHFINERKLDYSIAHTTLINRIPGIRFLSRKREHFFILNKYRDLMMQDCNKYFPETYLIPEDYSEYKKVHSSHPKRMYIAKTSNGAQGRNIHILSNPNSFKQIHFKGVDSSIEMQNDSVIQRYIDNPFLMNKKKHDLRLYVLIASVDPFVAFLNEEGLARFCTENYDKVNPS
jgi:tubulin polyglutamylase TTLL11